MPMFKGKDGKDRFHPNPQVGRAMAATKPTPAVRPVSPVGKGGGDEAGHAPVHARLMNYSGHDHNGKTLAHHVEVHHGAHPEGQPPGDERTSHHVIVHGHGGGGGAPGDTEIHNHSSFDEAAQDARDSMHADCPECMVDSGDEVAEPRQVSGTTDV